MTALIFLDDYLKLPDFRAALRTLAHDFRIDAQLPIDLDELGLVCPDVVAAADYLQKTYPGMGTFMLAEGSAEKFDENGRAVEYRTRVGFAYYQDVLLELAEAGTGSDIFSTHLDPGGRITIHHMGYFSRGDAHTIRGKDYAPILEKLGIREPEWSATVAAGMTIHVAIYNTYERAENLSLEFLDFRLLGLPVNYPKEGAQLLGEFQNRVGPRVLDIPGHTGGIRLQWSLHGCAVLQKSPSEVWTQITDPQALSKWMALDVQLVQAGQDGTAAGVGAVRRIHGEVDGHALDFEQTISESRPNLLLRLETDENGFFHRGQTVMTVTERDGGTELVWQISFVPDRFLTGPRIVQVGDAWVEASLGRLAQICSGEVRSRELRPEILLPES